jgi:very-short-patch-repair endonuclease
VDVGRVVGPSGWATRAELLQRVSSRTLHVWVRGGKLVRLAPGVYAVPGRATDWRVRVAAALQGREAVASHGTALALWELIDPPPGPIHLSVEVGRSVRGSEGVVLHRAPGAYADRRKACGIAVVPSERAIVQTWGRPGELGRSDVRAAAIAAVRERLCRPHDLLHELTVSSRLPGRAELTAFARLLADGCESELEIWGCLNVLRAPGMPAFTQQRRITVAGETFLLDAAYDDVLLAVELDGAAWHGSRHQRERDIRRDALLATIGWQTLRFGYRRMMSAPRSCQHDVLSAYGARRRLFGLDKVR